MNRLCNICPRQCNALRGHDTNQGGFCQMPENAKIARADLHFYEEPCISGKNGSGTIFFSGCNLKCCYCQNFEISHLNKGKIISFEELANIMKDLEQKGANNINFVNPSHYLTAIHNALKIYKPKIPLVYNSSGYDILTESELNTFDVFLFDLKYITPEVSFKYSGVKNYFEYASKAIKKAYSVKENTFNKQGIMQSGVIIRHLVLPMNTKESLQVIDWVEQNANGAYLSIMAQYVPCGNAYKFPEINRKITSREYNKVVDYALSKNLQNVYIQSLKSATQDYIPNFNLNI